MADQTPDAANEPRLEARGTQRLRGGFSDHRPRYDEGWQGVVWRWLGRRVELLARRVPYTNLRFDVCYHILDPLADRLVWRAIRRGMADRG